MRKDVLLFFIGVSLLILNYGYDRISEVLSKRDRLISLEKKKKQIESQIVQFQRLKSENREILSPLEYSVLLEKNPPSLCTVTAGKEKRDGDLTFIPAQVRCYVPGWKSVEKVVEELKKYPVSIVHYTYSRGTLNLSIRIYGAKK